MTKNQIIFVTLHNDKVVKRLIPYGVNAMKIQFLLNSMYGHMGWQSYKIKVTDKSKPNKNGKEK
jgi:hypothetical protein